MASERNCSWISRIEQVFFACLQIHLSRDTVTNLLTPAALPNITHYKPTTFHLLYTSHEWMSKDYKKLKVQPSLKCPVWTWGITLSLCVETANFAISTINAELHALCYKHWYSTYPRWANWFYSIATLQWCDCRGWPITSMSPQGCGGIIQGKYISHPMTETNHIPIAPAFKVVPQSPSPLPLSSSFSFSSSLIKASHTLATHFFNTTPTQYGHYDDGIQIQWYWWYHC